MLFINPLFLLAVAGAVIPVIIHLIRNKRAKKVKFSSLMFLKATPKELIKRRRLRDLILLIMRCLIFALLAFAFARPFIPKEKIAIISGERDKSIVLLIDNSYSLRYGQAFGLLRDEALKVLNNANPADEISLVFFSDEAKQATGLNSDISVHKSALENRFKPSYHATEYYKPLQLAEEILKDAKNPDKQIIMVSDFQNNGFGGSFENWNLEPGITFIPVKISSSDSSSKIDNVFIRNFSFKQRKNGSAASSEYAVEAAFTGRNDIKDEIISLSVNGRDEGSEKISSGFNNRVFFQRFGQKEGVYQGRIKTEDDNLNADNCFYFTYSIEAPPSIFCIDGAPREKNSNMFFLRSAFDLGNESIFKFTSGRMNDLLGSDLNTFDLVILTNINSVTNPVLNTLAGYISRGGNLIISFGDRVNPVKFSPLIEKLGVGKFNDLSGADRPLQAVIVGQVDFMHPVFSLFAESGAGEIFRPKFRHYLKIEPDSTAVVVGRYDSGDPFLIEKSYGKGRVLLFTSTFNTAWSDFPVHDIFVPFLYQLAGYAVSRESGRSSYVVGESVRLTGDPGEIWNVNGPDGENTQITIDGSGAGLYRMTEIPGNYSARSGNKKFSFSVNVDIKESDLRFRNTEEVLADVFSPDKNVRIKKAGVAHENIKEDEKRQKFWLYVILLVIFLFMSETYFAHKNYSRDK